MAFAGWCSMEMKRREFLGGVALAPWLVPALKIARLPIVTRVVVTCQVRRLDDAGGWRTEETLWYFVRGDRDGRCVEVKHDGRVVNSSLSAGLLRPFYDTERGEYGLRIMPDPEGRPMQVNGIAGRNA